MNPLYAIDSTRVTHREHWWDARSPNVLILWLTKWLRIRIPCSMDDPNVQSMLPFIAEALPAEEAQRFAGTAAELSALGFCDPIYHVFHDSDTATTIYWATFRHSSGEHFARIHHRIFKRAKVPDHGVFVSFLTEFSDGTFAVSSSGKAELKTPDSVAMNRREKLPATALWPEHLQFVAARRQSAIQPIRTREDLVAATERHHALIRDFNLARGVFRPRTEAEQISADAVAARVNEANAAGLKHADVIAEVERLQSTRPGWGNAILILVISGLAFVAAGSTQRDWKFYLWLIPLLFFHEAGHWIAMKFFGYRNLRMFFIPLFGAAVTGRHWNVPGWKKAIVSLAGPVPGILVGIAFTIAGLVSGRDWLNEAAFLLLIINGFNLLPVLPLDGGHVLHATLFCRNRWLDIAFRVIAIVSLLGLSLAAGGKFLMYIAILMAIGLPIAFKVGKITDAFRRTPMPPPLGNEDRIPLFTADTIISALKSELPAKTNNKTLALHTVNVCETLNAHPPGILGTLGLLTVHGGSFFAAFVCVIVLAVSKHSGGIKNFADTAVQQPRHEIACSAITRWSGADATPATARNVVISTLRNHAEAKRRFVALTNRLPAKAALTLAGESLLVSLPGEDDAAREKWFTEFQSADTNTFVALTNQNVNVSFMCVAPSEEAATNLVRELNQFFEVSAFGELVPPWSPEATGTKYDVLRHVRGTWQAIVTNANGVWSSPAVTNLNAQIYAARRRGAKVEAEHLLKEQAALRKQEEALVFDRLRAQGFDGELLDLYAKSLRLQYTNRVEVRELHGRIAGKLGTRNPAALGNDSARGGYANQRGLIVTVRWLAFKDAAVGLPTFVDWLCRRHCSTIKYDIHAATSLFRDLDLDEE